MKETTFWCFFGFGTVTVILALAGGFVALGRSGESGSKMLGFLILFLGASLIVMLGSVLFIRMKEGKR